MTTLHWLLLTVSSAIDLAVLLFLLRRTAEPLDLHRLAKALASAVILAALKMPVFAVLGGSLFFGGSLGWTTLVVVTPLAALVTLSRARRVQATRAVRVVSLLGGILLPALGFYGTFLEPYRLVEERVEVPIDPRYAPPEPLRVAVLADLQSREVDEHLREAVRRALAFEPHLIVLPGDLIQLDDTEEYDRAVPEFRELLRPLSAPLGVYFVIGNTDTAERVHQVFEGTNVRLLENEAVELDFHGKRVVLGGSAMSVGGRWTRTFLEDFDRREADELRLLIAHFPDAVLWRSAPPGTDLTIAGHTHGGQVQLPFFGPPITLSSVPRDAAAGGLHTVSNRRLYVSRGVGLERGSAPRLRFLCPPEVSLLTLRADRD